MARGSWLVAFNVVFDWVILLSFCTVLYSAINLEKLSGRNKKNMSKPVPKFLFIGDLTPRPPLSALEY